MKIWWNEFYWSQLDSTPLERDRAIFRSQEEADLLLLSLCWRQEKNRLQISRIIPTINLNHFSKGCNLIMLKIRPYQFWEAENIYILIYLLCVYMHIYVTYIYTYLYTKYLYKYVRYTYYVSFPYSVSHQGKLYHNQVLLLKNPFIHTPQIQNSCIQLFYSTI